VKHKLPFTHIKVMGISYEVKLVPSLTDTDGSVCWGDTDSENYVVRIVDGPRKRVNRVLCHELVHIWQDAQGRAVSEEEAERLEIALFDLFTNQPDLVDFLKKTAW